MGFGRVAACCGVGSKNLTSHPLSVKMSQNRLLFVAVLHAAARGRLAASTHTNRENRFSEMIDNPELIARLKERVRTLATATDEGMSIAAPPAADEQLSAVEKRLGVTLPDALKQLYREVGNGGWGPGPGLSALAEMGKPVAGLVSLCDWGGGILSLADCTRPEAPIIRRDPNMPKADVAERVPAAMHFARAAEVKEACWMESESLASWLESWLNGAALFYRAYDAGTDEGEEDDEEGEEVIEIQEEEVAEGGLEPSTYAL